MTKFHTSSPFNIKLAASELVDVLREKHLKLATAESCTGGLISKLITDIPGASSVFECGICAYSDTIKENVLSVSSRTLAQHTAVSKETAMEMSANIRKLSGADIGLSTTGFAGPKNPNKTDQTGLVFIGLSNMTKTTYLTLNLWQGHRTSRDYIRTAAAYRAIVATLDLIKIGSIK